MSDEKKPLPDMADGQFHFTVNGTNERAVDVISLRLAVEEAEAKHRLDKDEAGNLRPTATFLASLAGLLKEAGLPDCTPSLAYQLWCVSGGLMDGLKKNTSEPPNSASGMDSTPASSTEKPEPGSTSI